MRLSDLYPKLTTAEKADLASAAGISTGYLWQIATGWAPKAGPSKAIKRPTVELVDRLAKADPRLHLSDMVAEFSEARTAKVEAGAQA